MKTSALIRAGVGITGAGRVRGVRDSDGDGIIINSFLERIKFRELIMYIRVSCV